MHHYGNPLSVSVKDGRLLIEIGVNVLAHAVSYSDWANPYNEKDGDYIRSFAITNAEEFAKDVHRAMLAEKEDGSSPLSDFLDKVTEAAVDDGSTACNYEQRIKHGETAPSETWAKLGQQYTCLTRQSSAELDELGGDDGPPSCRREPRR